VAAADEALRLAPEDNWAHNSKALVMLIWGRSAESAERHKAERCYEETLRQCDRSIALASDEVEARFLKGIALSGLARVGMEGLATKYLDRALTALDEMLSVFSASLRNPGTKASSNSGFKDDER